MIDITTGWLQSIEALAEVPAPQLQWLIDNSTTIVLNAGDFLFKRGDPLENTYVIVEGRIRLYIQQNNDARELLVYEAKAITGYLPFSRGKTAPGYAEAVTETQVLSFPIKKTKDLICTYFELTQALVHVMTSRVREFTAQQQQNEKMMALGKLSAGLAHELNNPASAVVRGAASLKEHLQLLPENFKEIIEIRMKPEEVDIVNNKLFTVLKQKNRPVPGLMQRSNLEDDLTDWMEEHAIAHASELAENFAEAGFTLTDAEDFKQHIPGAYLSPVFNWINSNLVTDKMVCDIEDASRRIADLVTSVKTFTHMDQGHDKQFADIHSGIRNTLNMLQYKIRKGNVEVGQHFDTSLPPVKAMIGELNQVWTNLIDNALDAMEASGKGVLEIRTVRDRADVQVSVIDNGPGIPDNIRSSIFDPFFTTKEIGKGTGMGLDVVTRIVGQHRGSIKVSSVPGRTEFLVCFPINGEE
jgi:signal transduction histidine kinase